MTREVESWIDTHRQDLLNDIKKLCSIPSVQGAPEEGKPFGEGPYQALTTALQMAADYGFDVHNIDNYVGYADLDPSLPHTLDMLAHTDVVPAGEGWTVTEPFHIIEKDGRLYGRGTSDDKGPLMCALYAMRAIKETKTPLDKGVRMILGSDEETGSIDITKYYAKHAEAEMTFSPDAEFPLINIEKGQFRGTLYKDIAEDKALPRIISLDAGVALNAVPQKAVIRFEGLDTDAEAVQQAIRETAAECGVQIDITRENGTRTPSGAGTDADASSIAGSEGSNPVAYQEITVTGQSAHASTPETGRNAGLAAVILVNRLPLADSETTRLLARIPELFPYGVTDGSGIGIALSDDQSHDLSCTLDLYHVDPAHLTFSFDARTPVSATKENCEDVAAANVRKAGFDWKTPGMIPPHAVPGDGYFVQTLLHSYETITGLKGECMAIGGGTYVHDLKNGVAFGAVLPGIDTHMHGADEFFDIDNIMTATKVYAEAILELCGWDLLRRKNDRIN